MNGWNEVFRMKLCGRVAIKILLFIFYAFPCTSSIFARTYNPRGPGVEVLVVACRERVLGFNPSSVFLLVRKTRKTCSSKIVQSQQE